MARKLRVSEITYLIDTREQQQLDFSLCMSKEPLRVERATLDTGDYSVRGLERSIATVERKSLSDLLSSITHDRERFEKELHRMLGFSSRLVLVEASWKEIETGNWRNKVSSLAVKGSIQRYMSWNIPFHFAIDSRDAARFTANWLYLCAKEQFERIELLSQYVDGDRHGADEQRGVS